MERAVRLIMGRQQSNGEWLQEGIEGVFNKSVLVFRLLVGQLTADTASQNDLIPEL